MKKITMRLASLFMAFSIFMTSGITVSASGADAAGADVQTETGNETNGDVQTETGSETNGDAQTGAGNETNGDTQTDVENKTNGDTQNGTGQASPVEGEVVPNQPDQTGSDVSNGENTDTATPPVEGEVIQDENNDKVEIKKHDKPYLALGADLNDAQRATVLSIMGIDPAKLSDYDVVYITNDQEHAYLDAYIEASQIGSRSLSSVVIVERGKGNGLNISTNNITYCTVGMYKNALTTAGITDADIIVAGPTGISGTAALVGIFKAYQEMTGENIDDSVLDAALNELVITGELEASIAGLTNEEVEEFIAYIKSVIAKNDLKDEESINEAIDEACERYGVTLSDAERQKIVDLLLKITSLGIDLNGLVDYAESLYHSFKDGGGAGILSSIGDFFVSVFSAIADFFKGLFS